MRRLAFHLALVSFVALTAFPQAAPDRPAVPVARDRFKNLQLLGHIPQSQFFGTMAFMAGSLGVKCEFCHVAGDPASDDKAEKRRAREMIRMTTEINRQFFKDGEWDVTCQSCHRGKTRPAITPVPEQAFWNPKPPRGTEPPQSAADVIAKYQKAVGNTAALRAFGATVTTHFVNGLGGPSDATSTISFALPDRLRLEDRSTNGETLTIVNGDAAWIKRAGEVRDATPAERDDALRRASSYLPVVPDPAKLTPLFSESVDGKLAHAFETGSGADRQRLYFDAQTGLLVRRQRYIPTAFGEFPSNTDFESYQTVGGVRLPQRIVLKSVASYNEATVTATAPKSWDETVFERPKP
jgi:hypothetical protein